MTYEVVLVVHILGALATGLVGAYSLVALWNNFADKYKSSAIVLGTLAGFEVLSGTALSVLSLQISAASLCSRIFLYLALVFIIEALLFARMKKVSLTYPLVASLTPIAGSLGAFLTAIAYGF